jgi:hypothetical protein
VFLTAGQSLFAVAILVSLSMSRWEALVLAALFFTQFIFTSTHVRLGYSALYCVLAGLILITDMPKMRSFLGAAKEGWTGSSHGVGPPTATGPP